MARQRQAPEVVVRVTYVVDPVRARAAQDILQEGFRRGMLKLLEERRRQETPPVE